MSAHGDDARDVERLHGRDYADRFEHGQHPARIAGLMRRVDLPERAVVGDFGCGNALVLEHLDARIARYHGVDLSAPLLDYARRRARRLGVDAVELHHESIVGFCARHPGELDVALAFDLAEHVPDDGWLEILRAIRSALRPGGRLWLHTPNAEFVVELLKEHTPLMRQFPEHVAVRGPAAHAGLLRRAGFDAIDVRTVPHYNVLRLLDPLGRLPLVGRFFRARLLISARR